MTRKLMIVLMAVAAIAFAAALAVAAAPTGDLEVGKAVGVAAGSKGQVTFSHAKHGTLKCVECHHEAKTAADEANIKGCFTCHGKDAKAKGDITSKSLKENPMHINCVGCHKEQKKGPTKCKECHGGGDE